MVSCRLTRRLSAAALTSSPLSRSPLSSVAGRAIFAGGLAIVGIDREFLRLRMPLSTVLAGHDQAYQPCLLAFGEQQEGTTFFGGVSMPWGVQYHELLVGIPYVRRAGDSTNHLFVLGMTCDFWPAIWNGNFYYGFHKRFAPMRWANQAFVVISSDGRPEFHASLHGTDGRAESTFELIRTIASQPVLGWWNVGGFVRTGFDWDFSTASIRPVSLRLSLDAHFRELPDGSRLKIMGEAYQVRGMRWRLSWPVRVTT
jgi:hypothetical protein